MLQVQNEIWLFSEVPSDYFYCLTYVFSAALPL